MKKKRKKEEMTLKIVVNLLDHYLCAGVGQPLAKLVMEYYGLVDFLWDEQQLETRELECAKLLLRTTLGFPTSISQTLRVQPWYMGQGSNFIDIIVKKIFENNNLGVKEEGKEGKEEKGNSKIYYGDFHENMMTYYNSGDYKLSARNKDESFLYILNDETKNFDYSLWQSSVDEELVPISSKFRPTIFLKLPPGIGIFSSDKIPTSILENCSDYNPPESQFTKRTILFKMTKPSLVFQCYNLFGEKYLTQSIINWSTF